MLVHTSSKFYKLYFVHLYFVHETVTETIIHILVFSSIYMYMHTLLRACSSRMWFLRSPKVPNYELLGARLIWIVSFSSHLKSKVSYLWCPGVSTAHPYSFCTGFNHIFTLFSENGVIVDFFFGRAGGIYLVETVFGSRKLID